MRKKKSLDQVNRMSEYCKAIKKAQVKVLVKT